MYKRVEKRRKRQEEEDFQETDSDESDSSSDESESEESLKSPSHSVKRRKVEQDSTTEEEEEEGKGEDSDQEDDDQEDDGDGDSDDESQGKETEFRPHITVSEALENPLYASSLEPGIKGCLYCPGRLLKSPRMITVHTASGGHKRKTKRFTLRAKKADPESSAWDVLDQLPSTVVDPTAGLSERAQRRRIRIDDVKARREAGKEAKAQKLARREAKREKAAGRKAAKRARKVSTEAPLGAKVEPQPEPLKKKRKAVDAELGGAEQPKKKRKDVDKAKSASVVPEPTSISHVGPRNPKNKKKGDQRGKVKGPDKEPKAEKKHRRPYGESKKKKGKGQQSRGAAGSDGLKIFD